jgi:UDP-glucuronate 4-epimerase
MDFIAAIEKATGKTAKLNMMDMQAGDVPATWANAQLLRDLTGTNLKQALRRALRNSCAGIATIIRHNE